MFSLLTREKQSSPDGQGQVSDLPAHHHLHESPENQNPKSGEASDAPVGEIPFGLEGEEGQTHHHTRGQKEGLEHHAHVVKGHQDGDGQGFNDGLEHTLLNS